MYRVRDTCRSCGSRSLESVLDLGSLHVSAFPTPEEPDPLQAPLHLLLCGQCHLMQLSSTVEPDSLYRRFWYRSGVTTTMREALRDVVRSAEGRVRLRPGDAVLDIGSNDSTLLRFWPKDLRRLGFEPARNLLAEGRQEGIEVVGEYFSRAAAADLLDEPARVITAVAMFYDLDDPNAFLADVHSCLADDGLLIIQMAYLPAMLQTSDFGNICHEHLGYYSLTSLLPLLRQHGLHVVDIDFNAVNGGSFRVFASRRPGGVCPSVSRALESEKGLGLCQQGVYRAFAQRVQSLRRQVVDLVGVRQKHGPVHVYGASTKGNTMLQYWGLGRTDIEAAAERDERKYGRQMVGTRIPIIPEAEARPRARTFLVLPWHFRAEILRREEAWLAGRGAMLFPLPSVELVGGPP